MWYVCSSAVIKMKRALISRAMTTFQMSSTAIHVAVDDIWSSNQCMASMAHQWHA